MKIGNYTINKWQIVIMVILLIGLIVSVYLVLNRQIFKSKATESDIPFKIIQDMEPQQEAGCDGHTCTIKSLNIIIRPTVAQ